MELRQIKGNEFVEAKEAITDSLLNLTYRFVSGDGETGEYVFGSKPSRKFVSGFLLPAFDETGSDDETNDIHISNIGMDLQVQNPPRGELEVDASFSVYIRVLPTWEDIELYRLKPTFQLHSAIQRQIRDQIKDRTNALIAEEQAKSETDRRGRGVLRIVASEEIYRQHGITVSGSDGLSQLDDGDGEQAQEAAGEEGTSSQDLITAGTDARLPDNLVRPADIPQKWKRFSFGPEKVTIPLSATDLERNIILQAFEQSLWSKILQKVTSWVSSPEGSTWAYREKDVRPTHLSNKEAWDTFLQSARQTPPDIATLLPTLNRVKILCTTSPNYSDPSILNVRVFLENQNQAPTRSRYLSHETAIHQVQVVISLPADVHRPLRLERIQPSFRFRNFMTYPALGINCGVEETTAAAEKTTLKTTWLPKYTLPRITPRNIPGIPWTYAELCDPSTDINTLYRITDEYDRWIAEQSAINPAEYEVDEVKKHQEMEEYKNALNAFRKECSLVRRGIDLLAASQTAFKVDPGSPEAFPFKAWVLLNKTMYEAGVKKGFKGWRLFQEAFILAHIPTIASRIEEYSSWHDPELDEETATLLYFSTGGGKSEAFYGLLIFNLFFDRLRGKHRGVTTLIRYPLRLLTLQQAQRLFALLAFAEQVKHDERIPGAPFEIGFWVGRANTPNRNSAEEIKGILKNGDRIPAEGTPDRVAYEHANDAFNKIPICPYCEAPTGIRYFPDKDNRVAIICFHTDCGWNRMNGGITPLPFLLTDQDIYAHAPAIILGTIDKLALIGQHDSTITKIVGMLGLARFCDSHGRLFSPRKMKELRTALADPTLTRLAPAFAEGTEVFLDPFPSLIIQDEAHLLEESLGTFAGLFETTLEQLFIGISPLFGGRIARGNNGRPRLPKVVAATATISTPDRQIEALYQRKHLQFPYPGTSIYEGFYAHPQKAPNPARQAAIDAAPAGEKERLAELNAPWMRVYASIMTNGRLHTVTTVNVLAAFHVTISNLWQKTMEAPAEAVAILKAALSDTPLKPHHAVALDGLATDAETLLSLIDLFRISLTYVTNKKGGDQVIDALSGEAPKLHISAGLPPANLKTDLISGGVDVKAIQKIMQVAGQTIKSEGLQASLRNIVATSAISHGVDVDKFNAMFFAGTPTDIAEYIQASSRVGRTHVGFSLLVPVPQRRRDRYIVEVHDIFHRFLERMIAPAAIERWADNALKRVIPSLFQAWLIGCEEQRLFVEATDKSTISPMDTTLEVKKLIRAMTTDGFFRKAGDFIKCAVGVDGRGSLFIGQPNNKEYYESSLLNEVHRLASEFMDRPDTLTNLDSFWLGSSVAKKPMTSLRDIDEAGVIMATRYMPEHVGKGILRTPRIEDAVVIATKNVRKQTAIFSEMDSEGDA